MKTKNTFYLFLLAVVFLLGNTAQAHWTSKGPFGGRVNCLYSADTLVYIGSADGGVYRSNNASVTSWRYANYTGLSTGNINAITQSDVFVLAGTPAGIFRSNDIGATWSLSNSGLTTTNVLSLLTTDDHVLAGTNGGGIFMSHDNGATWEDANVGLTNLFVTCFAYDGTDIYAGTNGGGVFVSTDDGDSWTAINTGLTAMNITSLAVSGGNIFAGTATGAFFTGTGTIAWTAAITGLGSTIINSLTASGGTIYAGTNAGVYTSPDTAPTWTAANTGYNGVTTAVAVFGSKLYIGTAEKGVYRSNSVSSVSWSVFNNGFNNLEGYAVYNDGLLVIAATNKGLFVSKDLAANYVAANNGLNDSLNITSLIFAGSDLYLTTKNGGVFMSADTGGTWMQVNAGLTTLNLRRIISTNTHLIVGADNGSVFSTPISTINWSAATGLPSSLDITSFATDKSTHAFLGTYGNGVYMTMDYSSWMALNTGLTNVNVTSLAIKGSNVYAGTDGGGIFKSGFMGPSWTAVNTGLTDLSITALYSSGIWVVAGYKGGVHATYDNGGTWEPTNVIDYLPEYADVTCISFSPASTRIFASTPNNAFYSNGIAELPVGINEIESSTVFSIYPNPNNGKFNIALKNGADEIKEIVLFDASGKTVQQIPLNHKTNRYDFSVNVQKGIYLVKVFTTSGSTTQRIVVE